MNICYKFQNDFNDYFQDKNNKNINDYKSIFVSIKNEDNQITDSFRIFGNIDRDNYNDDSNINVNIFVNSENKDINIKDFHSFCKDIRMDFNDDFSNDFSNIVISLFTDIRNNINVCIVEVPNETAPSIQGFAKPPA